MAPGARRHARRWRSSTCRVDGFWKSFAAALVVAPAYVLVLLDQYRLTGWPEHPWGTALAEVVSFADRLAGLPAGRHSADPPARA